MASVFNENFTLKKCKSPMNFGLLTFTGILSFILVTCCFSNSVSAMGYNTSSNQTGITGFSQNNSIRNLTNPVLKMERNPLANLSNPLANLSNPMSNLSGPLANLSNSLTNLPNPLHNLTASQKSAEPLDR